jgi:hypothetical protein
MLEIIFNYLMYICMGQRTIFCISIVVLIKKIEFICNKWHISVFILSYKSSMINN